MKNSSFFARKPRHTLCGAYRFFGVKRNSYAGSIIERIYDYYCGGARLLLLEYLLYYRKEFKSFDSFLGGKYNMFPEEIEKKKSIFLSYKDLSFQPDYNVTYLTEYDSILPIIKEYLGVENDN